MLGKGVKIAGASMNTVQATGTAAFIEAASAWPPNASAAAARLCFATCSSPT